MTLWLVHILSEQHHLMESVQQWGARHRMMLTTLSGQPVRDRAFPADRLAICLRALRDRDVWHRIEEQMGQRLTRMMHTRNAYASFI